ncbi:putative ribonuclease H-like domain-containing protein [Tanacetum coccineum]
MRTRSQSRNLHHQQQQAPPPVVEPFNLEEPIENPAPPLAPMDDTRTMAQLLEAPTAGYEDAIVVPEITADNFELKHGLLNLVQNKQFFGHDKEDPHAHIRYFNKITSTMKFPNVPSTSVKLMLFPFSLEGAARIWLEKEPPRSIQTWDDLADIKTASVTVDGLGIKPVLLGVETGFEPGLAVVVSESESEEAEADDKADAEVQSEGTIEIEVDIATGIDIPDDLLMPDAIERLGWIGMIIESRQREQEGRNLTAEGERYGLLGCVVALEGSNTRLQDALVEEALAAQEANRNAGLIDENHENGDDNDNKVEEMETIRQCSDYTTLTSYSSVGPSWKRSWSLATSIPSMVRTAGALSPTQTDLLPPHKRYRGTSAMYSSESSDEGSLETHIELNIDTDIQAYIETTIATVDGLGIKPVIAGLKTGFELGLAVVESESEPKEAEADDKADAKVQIEGTIEIGVDVATGIDIPDDLLVPDAIDRLGQLEEVTGRSNGVGEYSEQCFGKLHMLKLGEYEMWEIRIKQYFQIQDYALWEVIENGNSWVPIPVTTPSETGTSTATKMIVPSTIEEKTCKKNDSMFAAIKARFGGNEATKKTQKALLKQQYENFSASSSESLDSIFNRLQKLVSRLAILGVVTPPEDLNVKFLRSLPSEWDTHVVVWMNKPDFDTMGLDDLYNNFKIVEQKVKKSAGASNDDKNLAFVTTSGASSTNNINTVNPEVSTATTKVNTASTEICTASFSDATVYAFLSTQPKGSQLVHEDLEQLHDDDLEEMDLKWNMALLSMRARKFYQRTGRKIIIDGSNTAGYDKSKVECFNCHKMGHFARECRAPRSKDNRNWNQGSSTKTVKIEDASEKAMCAIDGAGFDWSDMAEEEIQANMALMAFSDSEVKNDKSCSKNCLKNYEALKKQYDDLLVKLSDTDFKAATYKRGLATLEGQIVKYREHEVLFSEEIALLKRSVGSKEYQMGLLRAELEKVKQEKEGVDFKIAKFDKSAKDLNEMLESQITDKSKKGVGYNVVPSPHPLILNRPTTLDLSYSGLEEFKEPEVNEYGPRDSSLKPTKMMFYERERKIVTVKKIGRIVL